MSVFGVAFQGKGDGWGSRGDGAGEREGECAGVEGIGMSRFGLNMSVEIKRVSSHATSTFLSRRVPSELMAPAPLLLSPNLDRHLPFFSPRPSPTLGSESTPFLFVPPSPALSQSSFRTPPPSPRLGSFIVNSIDTVVPPNLKRVRKSTSSLVLLALAVTALFALGSYAVRSEASVGVRLKEWHSSFATAEALPDAGEDTGAEDPVDLQADEDEFGPSTPNVTSSAPADVLPPSTTPTALPVQEEVRPPSLPTPSAALPTTGPIPVSALPRPRLPLGGSTEKFIGYLPHSGFHNQRIELQNALLLGKLMNRTVYVWDTRRGMQLMRGTD